MRLHTEEFVTENIYQWMSAAIPVTYITQTLMLAWMLYGNIHKYIGNCQKLGNNNDLEHPAFLGARECVYV